MKDPLNVSNGKQRLACERCDCITGSETSKMCWSVGTNVFHFRTFIRIKNQTNGLRMRVWEEKCLRKSPSFASIHVSLRVANLVTMNTTANDIALVVQRVCIFVL